MPEVQFLIKNICPHVEEAFPGSNARFQELFPEGIAVWTDWPWRPRAPWSRSYCPAPKLHMTTGQAMHWEGVYNGVGNVVCEHMGQVIE